MRFFFCLLFAFVFVAAQAQDPSYAKNIMAFKKQDSVSFPAPKSIVFVGSSSFTRWRNLQEDFPGYKVINRAFGGSKLPDVIMYADEIIIPYKPKQVVIYCGENDLASVKNFSVDTVTARFKKLFKIIRTSLPKANIVFVSYKPSPSREASIPKMIEGNTQIREFLKTQRRTSFVNVYDLMVDETRKPKQELFTDDNLHMNEAGYAIWKKAIRPYLKK